MSRKSAFWLAASLAAVVALAPALAEARAGGSSSSGSRGSRTFQSAPATPTAPSAKPMERSATTQQRQAQPAAQPGAAPAAAQGGFMQRNPFMAGMLGGLIGVGLGGLLFGSGLFGEGLAGFAGFLGLLLQGALIAGVVYFAVAWFRRRQQGGAETPRPAYAYAGNEPASPDTAQRRAVMDVAPLDLKTGQAGSAPAGAPAASIADDLGLGEKDYAAFEERLVSIQKAWSEGDLAALRQHATPEMLSYFSEALSADASAGISNRVEDAVFEQGDLAEAWSEGNLQYATVAIRFRARDYTVRLSDGAVVEGNASEPVAATEVWTFLRNGADGRWLLSAIQQV